MFISLLSRIGILAALTFFPLISWAVNPSGGCGHNGLSSSTYTEDIDGVVRTFRVHVPRGYNNNNPAPLVTIFHGWGGNENEFIGNRKVRSEADKRGYILVAPRGLGSGFPDNKYNSWSFSGSTTGIDGNKDLICDESITPDYAYPSCHDTYPNLSSCSWTQCQADDVQFAVALVDHIKAKLCIDTDNVFATGGSNGGMFTWELGQNPVSANEFRAIAPIIGLPHRGYLNAQGKPGDMPVLVITGTRDTTVPPGDWEDPDFTTTSNGNDRYYYTGATGITEYWAAAHGCNVEGDATSFNDGNRKTDCRTYCSGDSGWPRVLDCRLRMGHSYNLNTSWKLVMKFFDQHSN